MPLVPKLRARAAQSMFGVRCRTVSASSWPESSLRTISRGRRRAVRLVGGGPGHPKALRGSRYPYPYLRCGELEQADALAVGAGHPFPGQTALPLDCLTVLTAELGDFSPHGFDLRQSVQPEQFAPFAGG